MYARRLPGPSGGICGDCYSTLKLIKMPIVWTHKELCIMANNTRWRLDMTKNEIYESLRSQDLKARLD